MLLSDDYCYSDLHHASRAYEPLKRRETVTSLEPVSEAGPFVLRHRVHVVASEAQQRATMARVIFGLGQHAEVYNDPEELIRHRPSSGIVLVHESDSLGAKQVCEALVEHGFWLPVMGFGDGIDAGRIIAGMKAGAIDYIVGEVSAEAVLEKLDACAREASILASVYGRRAEAKLLLAKLSDREGQVLNLLALGYSNKAIARELGISPRTVEIHRMKMMNKLGASSSAHAIRLQIDAGR